MVTQVLRRPNSSRRQAAARISIFMSVFNCHVNRSPVAGRIDRIAYRPGIFINAELDKASEDNERNSLVISTPNGRIGVIQIAGWWRAGLCRSCAKAVDRRRRAVRIDTFRVASRRISAEGTKSLVSEGQTAVAGRPFWPISSLATAAGLTAPINH